MSRLLAAIVAAGFALVSSPVTAQAGTDRPVRAPSAAPAAARVDQRPPADALLPGRAAGRPAEMPVAAANQSGAASRIHLEVTGLTPRTVTADGPPTVVVTGKVTNTGDRRIDDVAVRLQRGDAVTTEDRLRAVLRDPPPAERASSRWVPVAALLEPGQSQPFRVEAPLQGAQSGSLQIGERGVYPLMVNVNGQPDHGGQARLAVLSTLLPVLSLPGGPPAGKPPNPAAITMLWPLADRPRLVETLPGQPALLTDDDLTESFGAGGRLANLLQAAEQAAANPAVGASLCLAVDPDLLVTAQAMSGGYRVRAGATTVPGRGVDAAREWLARLRAFAPGHCLIALPAADADLVTLSRADQSGLTKLALSGTDTLQEMLRPAQPLTGVVWPSEGALDDRTLGNLAADGVTSVLVSPDSMRPNAGSQPVALTAARARVRGVRLDPLLAAALGGAAGQPRAAGVTTAADEPSLAVQNGLAALAFRTEFTGDPGRTVVIAPPHVWNASPGELGALVDALQNLFAGRIAVPVGLAQLVGGPMPAQPAALAYPPQDAPATLPAAVTDDVTAAENTLTDLTSAMQKDVSGNIGPAEFAVPFARNVLRSESSGWRGDEAAARGALRDATEQTAALQGRVTVVPPTNPLSWASGDSLLPALVTNELPVQVVVRVVLGDTQGVRPQAYDSQLIPAMQRRTLYIPVQVLRSGRLSVDVRLTTPSGTPLGTAARFEATSTAYSTVTIVITATAAAALVLLVARRIYRRVRSSRRGAGAHDTARGVRLPVNGSVAVDDVQTGGRTSERGRADRPEPAPRPPAGVPGEEGSSGS
ncbi:DUF6049 family protein [Gandjariella thermophila]|uniref:Glycoprotein n=1 Tax=Gandjariella thermophila TaxID=1931992 RepID=A0A4D4J8D5_9PSEU|nr:DUF6049 family protein [Gandjariella thermophila]GDY30918.1 glycoprotein [Gandjariella thermophila]